MTKQDHANTVAEAEKFKKMFDETILADISHGVNLSPFEEYVFNTGKKISSLLTKLIEAYRN